MLGEPLAPQRTSSPMPCKFFATLPLLALSLALASLTATANSAAAADDELNDKIDAALQTYRAGKHETAIELATAAVKADPDSPVPYSFRASLYSALRKYAESVADWSRAIELAPEQAGFYDQRGSERFKLNQMHGAIEDFDKFLSLRPQEEPAHWRRGIAYYYAGKYAEGAKQFEGYQTVADNDVENAVWRYICQVRQPRVGRERARADLLKIKTDRRIPLMVVYKMFAGEAKPEDVLTAAREGEPSPAELKERMFYAELYLGLFYESEGDEKLALEHLSLVADKYATGQYMWEVARVHVERLKAAEKKQ